tara:strand:+ start:562 stop:756 length:195 start_codon:yes stop_codon:yes gene_type:complete
MNKDILEGKWTEIKGKIKQRWGALTDDDLKEIEGNHQEIYGKLKKRYGYTKEQIEEELEDIIKH